MRTDTKLNKPEEADEWYKQALERARNIAKNLGQSSKGPSLPNPDTTYTKSTGNVPLQATRGIPQPPKYEQGRIVLENRHSSRKSTNLF